MMRALLAALALVLVATGAGAKPLTVRNERTGQPTVVRVRLDPSEYRGGHVGHFMDRADQLRAAGQAPAFEGGCYSACTVLMGVPGACATPSASFHFHSPQWQGSGYSGTDADLEPWRARMLARYPAHIRAAVQRDGALYRSSFTAYPASVLPRC